MRNFLGVAVAMWLGCGGQAGDPVSDDGRTRAGGLSLTSGLDGASGQFTHGGREVLFSSRQVEPGVFRLEVRHSGMVLSGLVDPTHGVSSLDGFAEDSGEDTQMLEGDRELLASLYAALNAQLPSGSALTPEWKYLRRAVGLWAEHPDTVELRRAVMGEQGRGYTMLCSYAKCNGKNTGSCGSSFNWYSYAKHDCQHGGLDAAKNQQIAQLGDHGTCDGDELYMSGGKWVCGEPDHQSRPKVMGNCFGRCGGGCGGDTQYTVDATNHDGCVRNGHALTSAYCNDQFAAASDDELYAPDCY
ncbi:MAG: hypothetical protein ABW123_16535 [Cystobacter sp.]